MPGGRGGRNTTGAASTAGGREGADRGMYELEEDGAVANEGSLKAVVIVACS